MPKVPRLCHRRDLHVCVDRMAAHGLGRLASGLGLAGDVCSRSCSLGCHDSGLRSGSTLAAPGRRRKNGAARGFGLGGADDCSRSAGSDASITRASGDRSTVDGADYVSDGFGDAGVLDVGAGSEESGWKSVGDLDGAAGSGVPDPLVGSRRPATAVQGLGQVQLDSPWTLFYGLLVLAGVTNFLPTRYGLAALSLGAGLVLELLGLTAMDWTARLAPRSGWPWHGRWPLAGGLRSGRIGGRRSGETLWNGSGSGSGTTGASSGPEDPGAVELRRRTFPRPARRPGSACAGVSSDNSRACGVARTGRGMLRGLIRRFVASERVDALLNTGEGDLAIRQRQRDDRGINSSPGRERS